MPVYNAARYIENAIQSLLNQTNPNWKLICIDDGSTDDSKEIISLYLNKDNRISLICQANAGPAVARARAIQMVDTEYVSILDSDDVYSPNYIELMLSRARETLADCIVPDVKYLCSGTQQIPNMFAQHHFNPEMVIEDGEAAFSLTLPWKLHGWLMVSSSLAKKYYTIKNASYSKFNSDEYITRLLYLKSKKTVLCKAEYQYRVSEGSITRTKSLKQIDYLKTYDKLLDLAYREHLNDAIIVELYNEYYFAIIKLLVMIRDLSNSDYHKGLTDIRSYYKTSYRRKFDKTYFRNVSVKSKIKVYTSLIHFNIFRLLVAVYYKARIKK